MPAISVAYTVIKNMLGIRKLFSFLPPHGIELKAGQTYTVIGDINTRLIPSWPWNKDPDRQPNPRKLKALKDAEMSHELVVTRVAKPHFHSALTSAFRKKPHLGFIDPGYKFKPINRTKKDTLYEYACN